MCLQHYDNSMIEALKLPVFVEAGKLSTYYIYYYYKCWASAAVDLN